MINNKTVIFIMCNCKYCGKEFENNRSVASHVRHCKNNPNYDRNLLLSIAALRKGILIVLERTQNDPLNIVSEYLFYCSKCGKPYTLQLKQRDYLNGDYRKTCSVECANSHKGLTKGKTKVCKCLKCGEKYEISIHACEEKFVCEKCKHNEHKKQLKNKNIDNVHHKNGCFTYSTFCKCMIHVDDCCKCKFFTSNICTGMPTSLGLKIKTLVKYCDFNVSKCIDEQTTFNEFCRVRQMILTDIDNGLSCVDVCLKYTGSPKKGNTIFKVLGVKTRTLKDAVKNSFIVGKGLCERSDKFYITEHHNTWNNKLVFLRSSYETSYANELDKQKINYDVESLRIKYFDTQRNEYRCAIPDFYLPDTNTIVEIKSTWTLDIQNMKDKFKAYKDLGYNFKLILEHKEVNIDNL